MDDPVVKELLQRSARIETRLTRLCLHMGLDPTDKDRVLVLSTDPPTVSVSGFDISLGNLLDGCRKSGINTGVVVMCNGVTLGMFYPHGDHNVRVRSAQDGCSPVQEKPAMQRKWLQAVQYLRYQSSSGWIHDRKVARVEIKPI
jgi:hypothetical protein